MKRIILFLSILIICFSIVVAHADDAKELTFQGIPWFSTPEEASSILLDAGFINEMFGEKNINKGRVISNLINKSYPYFTSSIATDPDDEECPYTYVSDQYPPITRKLQAIEILNPPKTIAKTKISAIHLYFTPDAENRQLVECVIAFRGSGKILDALKEAYGEQTTVKNKRIHIWMGANNTIVVFNSGKKNVNFATIDGLNLAETYDIEIPETSETELEDTGF